MKSIVQEEKECFICGCKNWLELHHIFGASNRKNSTKYGLTVYLCHKHHNEPPNSVHFNRQLNDWLKAVGQNKFNEKYPNLDFIKIFGKNYL